MIAQEVTNQSYSNLAVEKKLFVFLKKVEEIEGMVKRLESRIEETSARIYSDGNDTFCLSVCLSLSLSFCPSLSLSVPLSLSLSVPLSLSLSP